ncbi:MAG: transposase, partial [Burkholderiales bacterium]
MRSPNLQVSFADLELQRQAVGLDDAMSALSAFLDTAGELVNLVHQDLVRGLKNTRTGRSGMTALQALRSFILRRLKNWDYQELSERIADSFSLRLFTKFYSDAVPTHSAFHSTLSRLRAQTVRAINEAVVRACVTLGLEDGKKLRVDTTVVQTDIHYPTDSSLLWDSVRVTTRLVGKLGECVPELSQGFHNRSLRARRRKLEIDRMEKSVRPRQMKRKYRELIAVTQETLSQAQEVAQKVSTVVVTDVLKAMKVEALRDELVVFC